MCNKYYILILSLIHFYLVSGPGDLDITFGTQGFTLIPMSRNDIPENIAIQADDKSIIVGSTHTTDNELFLARYTSNGVLDTLTFNSAGATPGTQTLMVGSRSEGNGIALQGDGKIVVAGFAIESQTNILIARFNTDGSLDTAGFNSANGYNTLSVGTGATANALGLQSTGQSIVAGASVIDGSPQFTVARFNTNGTLDTTFGTSGITTTSIGVIASIQALVIQADDKIVVVGHADNQPTLVRYNADGSIDTGFGSSGIFQPSLGMPAVVYDIALDSIENIIVVGSAVISGIDQSLVFRCTSSGALDPSFNGTGIVTTSILYGSEFFSVSIQPYDYICAAGYAKGALSDQLSIAQYTDAGLLDTGFGTNGITTTILGTDSFVQAIGEQSTSDIIVFGTTNGVFYVGRYVGP